MPKEEPKATIAGLPRRVFMGWSTAFCLYACLILTQCTCSKDPVTAETYSSMKGLPSEEISLRAQDCWKQKLKVRQQVNSAGEVVAVLCVVY